MVLLLLLLLLLMLVEVCGRARQAGGARSCARRRARARRGAGPSFPLLCRSAGKLPALLLSPMKKKKKNLLS